MRKYKKLLIIVILIIGLIFLINSRRVDKVTFKIMALSAQNDIRTTCFENKKFELGLIKNKPSLYYIDISLNELCNDDDKIKEMAEKHMKEYFRGNWKFVY